MLCCGLGALLIAMAVLPWKRLHAATRFRPLARSSTAATLAAVLLVFSALVAEHLGHYVDRARANERALLAELIAQPICTGAAASAEPVQTALVVGRK